MMTDDEEQWTRLIDGELSFAEQRALLGTLDEAPDGWKRLALGLLEAETFRRELRNCAPPEPVATRISPEPAKRLIKRRMPAVAACAISLVCLGLGMGIERMRRPVTAIADRAAPAAHAIAGNAPAQQTLKLVFADGPAGAQSVEVPVIDGQGGEAAGLLQQSALPEEVRRRLEAQGYVIHEERTYVPVSLANGRQGIAPISDVVVEPGPVLFQ